MPMNNRPSKVKGEAKGKRFGYEAARRAYKKNMRLNAAKRRARRKR